MPYSKKRYGSKKKYRKFKRCVRKVSKKQKEVNPFAVCRKSIYGKKRKQTTIVIRTSKRYGKYLKKHLNKEHPKTKGKISLR